MEFQFSRNKYFAYIFSLIIYIDILVISDFPFLRQIFGFVFLSFIPGILILRILKLNKIGFTEKFVLSVGLSISFLMLFGIVINNFSLGFGYVKPLSFIFLLIAFNILFLTLLIIGYKVNEEPVNFSLNLTLTTSEKKFLVIPLIFPTLSLFGIYVMNTTNNNVFLMLLLFLIPSYVAFVSVSHKTFPVRLYPIIIFLISMSLLLLLSLRSNDIIGVDIHLEYYMFQKVLNGLHWVNFKEFTLDSCLSISLLPTIYKSFLNLNSIFLFKVLYSLIYSISPLVIYIISNKYIDKSYSFLASCFYMFQLNFLFTEYNARTNLAILFFGLSIMVLFNEKIGNVNKKFLLIVFMISCLFSHYSTTYIFFFILLGSFIFENILSLQYKHKYKINSTTSPALILLFFILIFFWYGQITETPFNNAIHFIENSISSLNAIFIDESRQTDVQALFGEKITQKGVPHKIHFICTWISFLFIGVGMITSLLHFKDLLFSKDKFKNILCLNKTFDIEFFLVSVSCLGLLFAIVIIPNVSVGYNIDRLYALTLTNLSIFFVIGGIILSKYLNIKPQFLLLIVLIPYFLSISGVTYQVFGAPNNIILNSDGGQYDILYVHEHESYSAKWLKSHSDDEVKIRADLYGMYRLASQAGYSIYSVNTQNLTLNKKFGNDYLYLRYANVVKNRILNYDQNSKTYSTVDFYKLEPILLCRGSCIYNNGGSEIYT